MFNRIMLGAFVVLIILLSLLGWYTSRLLKENGQKGSEIAQLRQTSEDQEASIKKLRDSQKQYDELVTNANKEQDRIQKENNSLQVELRRLNREANNKCTDTLIPDAVYQRMQQASHNANKGSEPTNPKSVPATTISP